MLITVHKTSAHQNHPLPATHTLNHGKPTVYILLWLPPTNSLAAATCQPQYQLPLSGLIFQEATGVAVLSCRKRGGRLPWATAAVSVGHLLVSGRHFSRPLTATMGCTCTFWLRKTSVDTQAVFWMGWRALWRLPSPGMGARTRGKNEQAFTECSV